MENGRYNLPDYDAMEDEAFPPLPPPHSPGRGGADEEDPFANGETLYVCQHPTVREYSAF